MFLTKLQEVVDQQWDEVKKGLFWKHIERHGVSRELWRHILIEIYHYTRHNSINQAVAAYRVKPEMSGLLSFCYKHASEELGHEHMIVHDLKSIGFTDPGQYETYPLPPTQSLISYLYYISLEQGAIPRLGYSFWAEDAYDHLDNALAIARRDLELTDDNMSFFIAHSNIDEEHSQEVKRVIEKFVTDERDREKVMQVAQTTLYLTGNLLDAATEKTLAATEKTLAYES